MSFALSSSGTSGGRTCFPDAAPAPHARDTQSASTASLKLIRDGSSPWSRAAAQESPADGAGQPRLCSEPGPGAGPVLPVDAQGKGQDRFGRPFERAVRGDAGGDRQRAGSSADAQAHGADHERNHLPFAAGHEAAQAIDQEGVGLILAPFRPVP